MILGHRLGFFEHLGQSLCFAIVVNFEFSNWRYSAALKEKQIQFCDNEETVLWTLSASRTGAMSVCSSDA